MYWLKSLPSYTILRSSSLNSPFRQHAIWDSPLEGRTYGTAERLVMERHRRLPAQDVHRARSRDAPSAATRAVAAAISFWRRRPNSTSGLLRATRTKGTASNAEAAFLARLHDNSSSVGAAHAIRHESARAARDLTRQRLTTTQRERHPLPSRDEHNALVSHHQRRRTAQPAHEPPAPLRRPVRPWGEALARAQDEHHRRVPVRCYVGGGGGIVQRGDRVIGERVRRGRAPAGRCAEGGGTRGTRSGRRASGGRGGGGRCTGRARLWGTSAPSAWGTRRGRGRRGTRSGQRASGELGGGGRVRGFFGAGGVGEDGGLEG
ncbi:hypothetical protein BJ912DRAFT_930796 [Pholiota molesta]|nr:hypothetical protein BJ912DRAFT_930796 [Pholiota molesta]